MKVTDSLTEIPKQNLTDQPFKYRSGNDLDGHITQTEKHLKINKRFQNIWKLQLNSVTENQFI